MISHDEMNKVICKISRKWQDRYGGDLKELIQQAWFLCYLHLPKYNPQKCKVTTWAWWVVWHGFLDVQRNNAKRKAINIPGNPGEIPSTAHFDFDRFMFDLSPSAQEVVTMALDLRKGSRKKERLAKLLRARGWKEERIAAVFDEIQGALYE